MKRLKLAATLALCTAGLLTGCAGVQPGVAVQVGDETIRVSEINRITDGYCQAYERQLESDGEVLPMEFLVSNILYRLALSAAARQLADEYGVTPSSAYTENVATLEQTVSELEPLAAEARLAVEGGGAYVSDILTSIGRQELESDGVADPSEEEALARGQDVMTVWLAENEPDVDPQYGLRINDLQPSFIDTSTSFAVSDEAVAGSNREPDSSYAGELPDSQRCG